MASIIWNGFLYCNLYWISYTFRSIFFDKLSLSKFSLLVRCLFWRSSKKLTLFPYKIICLHAIFLRFVCFVVGFSLLNEIWRNKLNYRRHPLILYSLLYLSTSSHFEFDCFRVSPRFNGNLFLCGHAIIWIYDVFWSIWKTSHFGITSVNVMRIFIVYFL